MYLGGKLNRNTEALAIELLTNDEQSMRNMRRKKNERNENRNIFARIFFVFFSFF
jgi:hypothetical protein